MHLLAAKPGGFSDDEGIVDLEQTAADIVILSAADTSLAALASALDHLPAAFPSVRLANWMQLGKPAAFDLYQSKVLDHARVVVLSLLGGESYWPYGVERLRDWAAGSTADAPRHLLMVPGDDAEDANLARGSTATGEELQRTWRFLREGGVHNAQHLLRFLAASYLAHDQDWQEPRVLPKCLVYWPDDDHAPGRAGLQQWQQQWQQTNPGAPVCLLLFYRSHLLSGNTAMFHGLLQALQEAGLNPLPVAIASLKDAESAVLVNNLLQASAATLVINTTAFASNSVVAGDHGAGPSRFSSVFERAIPVLQLILSSSTEEDWTSYSQGLRSRDIAMQVVLPEMDGRIVTRAISFKSEAHYNTRAQCSVVRYALHEERARFVASFAANTCRLASKVNAEKRIGLVLANYPTKDGRIGNGVGLDTAASTVTLLHALQAAGYPVQDVPADGTALVALLQASVTNNPDTVDLLPCWQSLDLAAYRACFEQLPQACQDVVLARWGQPEQDPRCRQGRLMLAGVRLGETFVGIQPSRGYNLDLTATYHDPDLVPPHSYLAFYFWLREVYRVDALVHVGKHGNLEWLPGKGNALSAACWPDIALGPLPHFYPFIVNDPGEGAQAKRRSQAVIIDHLMPPLARAETYGELAELEGLVDEYYQALGMDAAREAWLRQRILEQMETSHLRQELAPAQGADEDALLAQLDAYLCDIKEAQIRHGLHRLGELPGAAKLAETLLALLRLPRGEAAVEQGLLHSLAGDLGLMTALPDYDPLELSAAPWEGPKPDLLAQQGGATWRSVADTREKLELLAQHLLETTVVSDSGSLESWQATLPATATVLAYAREVLLPALQQGVGQEVGALLEGLAGGFVEPGPSGAPSRGRLDTLPTGRNFFSVDNRAIPSAAAWAIGERAAQAFIDKHLQEEGDYPRQVGLSVWGTATMRTGGDDIAQALALMGVRPIWAAGSQRVVDVEIVPAQLLGRPRVDVTLRVSGFFRDAFPNVIRLYDTAVRALADYDDPGQLNRVREHIDDQAKALCEQGMDPDAAHRQASYRVFGSKPGAYGAGLQGLIDERCWEQRRDLAEAYLNWGGYAYGSETQDQDGVPARTAFANRLEQLDSVLHNQDNREHDLLDSDDYYQFQGGMINAVTELSGRSPATYHGDHSNPARPVIRTLKQELNRVLRSRVLNPKWITAMREHGYKGAFEMAATVDYVFAYDATTNLIDDYQYRQVAESLVLDGDNQAFLRQHNPAALEEMAERLLEAQQRGMWGDAEDAADQLQELLLDIDAGREGM